MTSNTIEQTTEFNDVTSPSWSGVIAMSVCAFALVASEFLPVSLLTPIAKDLNITEGMAGQGITISGFFAVITSLSVSVLAGNMNRKTLLLFLTAIMGVSGGIVAFANNFYVYMLGRALIGVVVGGFWSMSAATAIRLVPEKNVATALAILNGGNALASVVAAPLGAYLGSIFGWRGAFLFLVPISLTTFIWQSISLPNMKATATEKSSNYFLYLLSFFKEKSTVLGMISSGLFFMGQFTLFTYIRPFMETITKMNVPLISFVLLFAGFSGCIGTFLIGFFIKKSLYRTLFTIPVFMAVLALLLVSLGSHFIYVVILLSLWGLLGTSAPAGWWAWIAKAFSINPEAGGSIFVAVVQVSIAFGSTAGGLLFDNFGYSIAFTVSAALLFISGLFAILLSKVTAETK